MTFPCTGSTDLVWVFAAVYISKQYISKQYVSKQYVSTLCISTLYISTHTPSCSCFEELGVMLDVILDEGCDEEIAVVIALEQNNNVNTGSADRSFFVS